MENALEQLHQIDGIFVPSWSPFGLLGGLSTTASWDSSSSPKGPDIRDSTDLFGAITWRNARLVRNTAGIALKLLPGNRDSLGMGAQYFDEWRQGEVVSVVLTRVLDIIAT